MGDNQRASSSLKDSFFQIFSYDSKATPFDASLNELLKSCPYTESAPTKFSVCYTSLKELSLFQLYSSFINFTQRHQKIDPIQECIFPLFCHIVMYFRINDDADRLNDFVSKKLETVPVKFKEEVDDFLLFDKSKTYHQLSLLLSTQLYRIKCTYDEYKLLNDFLNEPMNFQLKRYMMDIITIEILQNEVDDKSPTIIFKNKTATSNLNILNIKMKEASFASILSDLSSVFLTVYDTQVCQIHTQEREYQQLYSHSSAVTSMSISNSSKLLLTTDLNGDAILYDNYSEDSSNRINRIECITPIWCSTFAPQGGVFALGTHDRLIHLCDPTKLEFFRSMVGHTEPIKSVLFHPNCSLLGSLSYDPSFRIWDIRQAETSRIFIGRQQKNSALSFAPNGRIAAFFDGELEVCDIGKGEFILSRKDLHDIKNVEFTCFSADSSYLYVVCTDGKIVSIDLNDGNFKQNDICRLEANVLSCKFVKSGDLVVATAVKPLTNTENEN